MANLTIYIDDTLLQTARARALEEGTSVDEVCRRAIEAYAGRGSDRLARYRALRERIDAEASLAESQVPAVRRDDLYDELFNESRSGTPGGHERTKS